MAKRLKGLQKSLLNLAGDPLIDTPGYTNVQYDPKTNQPISGQLVRGSVLTGGIVMSASLARGQSQDPIKTIKLAHKIREGNVVEIEDDELGIIQTAVLGDQYSSDLMKAHCLLILQDADVLDLSGAPAANGSQPARADRRRATRAAKK